MLIKEQQKRLHIKPPIHIWIRKLHTV